MIGIPWSIWRAVRLEVKGLIFNNGRQSTSCVLGGALILSWAILLVRVFRHIKIITQRASHSNVTTVISSPLLRNTNKFSGPSQEILEYTAPSVPRKKQTGEGANPLLFYAGLSQLLFGR